MAYRVSDDHVTPERCCKAVRVAILVYFLLSNPIKIGLLAGRFVSEKQ